MAMSAVSKRLTVRLISPYNLTLLDCGDNSALVAAGSTQVDDSECNTPCSGDATYICGQGNLLSYYNWIGDPLYVWDSPTDYHKGSYEFLIGGVVVPLITSLAVNGKVTFLEKVSQLSRRK